MSVDLFKINILKSVTGQILATEHCIVCGGEVKRYVGNVLCAIEDTNKNGYTEKEVAAGFCLYCSRVIDNCAYCFDENRTKIRLREKDCLRPYKEHMGLQLISKHDERIWRDE